LQSRDGCFTVEAMCGRFTLTSTPESLAERFGLPEPPACSARYNVAPGQPVLTVRGGPSQPRRADFLRWGLVPSWADSPVVGGRMINARAESASAKPAFRDAFRARRCIVPADGFYEWSDHHPYWIAPPQGGAFGFAGLWETWRASDGAPLETCTVLTTQANDRLAALHPRMPVILARGDEDAWLDITLPLEAVQALLRPLPDDALAFHPVGTRVNRVDADDPGLIARVPDPPRQTSLF
jgi:putative SOS response-associated peptidase YedK